MTALFFGDSESPLLGVWTAPSERTRREHGVLLCPPIGQEHVRSHWALRQLATALCKAGFDCFRFDWFGVGDSAGVLSEASLARWRADLASAAQELRDAAGVRDVSVVGLRFGATLAALGAADAGAASLVLWDPVVAGRAYLRELRALTDRLVTDPARYFHPAPTPWLKNRPTELVGFDFGERLMGEIEGVDIGDGATLPRKPLCFVLSSTAPDAEALGKKLGAERGSAPEIKRIARGARWSSPEDVEQLLLPGDALRATADFLGARASG